MGNAFGKVVQIQGQRYKIVSRLRDDPSLPSTASQLVVVRDIRTGQNLVLKQTRVPAPKQPRRRSGNAEAEALAELGVCTEDGTLSVDDGVLLRLQAETEATLLQSFKARPHKNVVRLVSATCRQLPSGQREYVLLMEYASEGSLRERLKTGPPMTLEQILSCMSDVVDGLSFLHAQNLAHRDVTIDNIVMDSTHVYKLCDLGSAQRGDWRIDTSAQQQQPSGQASQHGAGQSGLPGQPGPEEDSTSVGSHLSVSASNSATLAAANLARLRRLIELTVPREARPPEMVHLGAAKHVGLAADIWQLGCVFYQLLFRLPPPFAAAGPSQLLTGMFHEPERRGIPRPVLHLMRAMLSVRPSQRPRIEEVKRQIRTWLAQSDVRDAKLLPEASAPVLQIKFRPRRSIDVAALSELYASHSKRRQLPQVPSKTNSVVSKLLAKTLVNAKDAPKIRYVTKLSSLTRAEDGAEFGSRAILDQLYKRLQNDECLSSLALLHMLAHAASGEFLASAAARRQELCGNVAGGKDVPVHSFLPALENGHDVRGDTDTSICTAAEAIIAALPSESMLTASSTSSLVRAYASLLRSKLQLHALFADFEGNHALEEAMNLYDKRHFRHFRLARWTRDMLAALRVQTALARALSTLGTNLCRRHSRQECEEAVLVPVADELFFTYLSQRWLLTVVGAILRCEEEEDDDTDNEQHAEDGSPVPSSMPRVEALAESPLVRCDVADELKRRFGEARQEYHELHQLLCQLFQVASEVDLVRQSGRCSARPSLYPVGFRVKVLPPRSNNPWLGNVQKGVFEAFRRRVFTEARIKLVQPTRARRRMSVSQQQRLQQPRFRNVGGSWLSSASDGNVSPTSRMSPRTGTQQLSRQHSGTGSSTSDSAEETHDTQHTGQSSAHLTASQLAQLSNLARSESLDSTDAAAVVRNDESQPHDDERSSSAATGQGHDRKRSGHRRPRSLVSMPSSSSLNAPATVLQVNVTPVELPPPPRRKSIQELPSRRSVTPSAVPTQTGSFNDPALSSVGSPGTVRRVRPQASNKRRTSIVDMFGQTAAPTPPRSPRYEPSAPGDESLLATSPQVGPVTVIQNVNVGRVPHGQMHQQRTPMRTEIRRSDSKEALTASHARKQDDESAAEGDANDINRERLRELYSSNARDELRWEDLTICERIGIGGFAEVFRAEYRGREVAVKKLINQRQTPETLLEFKAEVQMMRKMSHANVCEFIGACTVPPNLCLVTELLEMSLFDLLHNTSIQLTWKLKLKIALDTARGLRYLHNHDPPILHRDLKSANLLLDSHFGVRIADFGLSRVKALHYTMTGQTGTFQWMSPEVIAGRRYNEKADIYSYGIILWELCMREVPYDGWNGVQVSLAVVTRGLRPQIDAAKIPHPWAKLIKSCWHQEPHKRPSFDMIVAYLETLASSSRRQRGTS